jgi:tRNA threonylcarbamoyladenosine biosynthesis protein TsaB
MNSAKRILAFDTSSTRGLVVAFEQGVGCPPNIIAEWSLSLDTGKHSERLLWSIDSVLQAAGWDIKDLHAMAVGVGPGSFTGLRIGITTARMLSSQLSIPLYPIDSLRIQSWSGYASCTDKNLIVFSCADAAKGEWFYHLSKRGVAGISKIAAPSVAISDLESAVRDFPWLAVGPPVTRHAELFSSFSQANRILASDELAMFSSARGLAAEVARVFREGAAPVFSSVLPTYLRASDAEVKLKAGLLPKAATDF